ncbi:MAG TPA: Gfo/Idh/MocA family oxidoreductase [Verrucomicrobiales bacterium]|nr:Gfo/Idh/MocA family oxidoreductase [Verrucomicrobiales bacterium]
MNPPERSRSRIIQPTRRGFLGAGATAAAGSVLAQLPVQSFAQVEGRSRLKVALVGCGGRGTGAANETLSVEGTELVAMADVFRDRLDGAYAQLSGRFQDTVKVTDQSKFIGFDAYLKAIDLADVVILATPPGFRPMMFEAAVDAGKHVFMEKPVATDAPGIRRVLEAAKKADEKKLKVVVGLQRHYETIYLETLKRIQDGAIGDIVAAQCYWNGSGVWVRERRPGQTEMEYQVMNWYYFVWLCGDHIVEQHVHNIDVVNWFKGGPPVRAQGMGGREVRKGRDNGEIFDHHYVEFTYADGTICNSQCRHIPNCWDRVSESFQGTQGRAEPGRIYDLKGEGVWRHRGGRGDPNAYQVEHDVLYRHIREDIPVNNAYYGASSTMTAILGRLCTYSGQSIGYEEALNSNVNLFPDSLAWDAMPKVVPDAEGRYPVAVPGQTKVL